MKRANPAAMHDQYVGPITVHQLWNMPAVTWKMRYVTGVDERGDLIDVRDPLAARLQSISKSSEGRPDRLVAACSGWQRFLARTCRAKGFRANSSATSRCCSVAVRLKRSRIAGNHEPLIGPKDLCLCSLEQISCAADVLAIHAVDALLITNRASRDVGTLRRGGGPCWQQECSGSNAWSGR